ncbi:hypothetical protein ACIHIX_47750 [Streptomyces sp. NPDC051913]|uniref:hypothetical protein n=1 Tax=Streptomyces sp. NPDC051913 TaxID=3365676 RepID=UPI0037CD44DD
MRATSRTATAAVGAAVLLRRVFGQRGGDGKRVLVLSKAAGFRELPAKTSQGD